MTIRPRAIEEEMKKSFLEYAMSVIVARALPDVRDGLKPVHRRILYAMHEAGYESHKPHKKSARVVGEVMSKYHPHGDSPIYDALVRLAQDFSMSMPLIDGQGNFGSMDGDMPAAMRYTESRLSKFAKYLLIDIDQETVDFQPNYDNSTHEPLVLPSYFPNLLVNGSGGIAVGMATNVPPHNLGEILDACCALLDDPSLEVVDLMQFVQGPDMPTKGLIIGRRGIYDAYTTGRGSITLRSTTEIETHNNKEWIIITSIPYQVNKSRLIEKIADSVRDKTIEGISELRDESNREGVRVVIELKRDASSDVVLNQLYRHTQVQTSFSINLLALNHGRPECMSLKQMLEAFLQFREEVLIRRLRYELQQARAKAHVSMGLAVAINNIDQVLTMVRQGQDRNVVRQQIQETKWPLNDLQETQQIIEEKILSIYTMSEIQAQAILDMRLHRLTSLERDKIKEELYELKDKIQTLLRILDDRNEILKIMRDEFLMLRENFAHPRRTEIVDGDALLDVEDLIQSEDMVVTVSVEGYIKRVPLATYRAQKRGGKGRSGMSTKEEDTVKELFVADTLSPVLFFSTTGQVYQLKVYKLPLGSLQAKGRPMVNMLPLDKNETIAAILVLPKEPDPEQSIVFATSAGNVRRNKLSDFLNLRANGKKAIRLEENETLIGVKICNSEDILLCTKLGKAIRFSLDDLRVFAGRDSNGVRGIKLQKGDEVISLAILQDNSISFAERNEYLRVAAAYRGDEYVAEETNEEGELTPERLQELSAKEEFILTISDKGYGKRTSAYAYRRIKRGGSGVENMSLTNKSGSAVVASFPVHETDGIILATDGGQVIRCAVNEIRITGRTAQGVIVFRVPESERIVAISKIEESEESEEE